MKFLYIPVHLEECSEIKKGSFNGLSLFLGLVINIQSNLES